MKIRRILPHAAAVLTACQSTPSTPPDRFAEADVNKDGKLSRAEMSDYVVAGIFVTRDANGDGRMTRTEWNPENDPALTKGGRLRDVNRDGIVTLEEAKAYARTSAEHNQVFKDADTNKDGGITREEAQAYYASKEGPFH